MDLKIMASDAYYLIKDLGFPMAIALILLYDKIRTNGSMLVVVENNNSILRDLKEFMLKKL